MVGRFEQKWMCRVGLNMDKNGQVGGQIYGGWWRVQYGHVDGGMISEKVS